MKNKIDNSALINDIIKNEIIQQTIERYTSMGFGQKLLDTITIYLSNVNNGINMNLSKMLINAMGFDPSVLLNNDMYRFNKIIQDIVTDLTFGYSAFHTHLMATDLGLEWFRYSGSNLANTRIWCLAMREKKYFHYCEIDSLIKGDFEEFRNLNGIFDDETGMPTGLYPSTNSKNVFILRGGYGCGHQILPISEDLIPDEIKERVYNSIIYKKYKTIKK